MMKKINIFLVFLIAVFVNKEDLYASSHHPTVIRSGLDKKLTAAGELYLRQVYTGTDYTAGGFTALELFSLNDSLKQQTRTSSTAKSDPLLIGKKAKGTTSEIQERQELLARIIAMMWQLDAKAAAQGEGFTSGSFKIIDPGYKLYNFLLKYVKLARSQSSSFAYERNPQKGQSSHYKDASPESQFGIDVRFEANESSLQLLPQSKSHIIFGKIAISPNSKLPLLFIKLETIGLGSLSDKINHGIGFLKTRADSKELLERTRKEKYIKPEIQEAYNKVFAIFKTFDSKDQQDHSKKPLMAEKPKNISSMIEMLNNAKMIQSTSSKTQASLASFKAEGQKFMDLLAKIYPNDKENIFLRTGHEVIIDLNKL
ncbi:hypothetical protein IM40_06975 [Candidatus Paracaedimonas acanthamoebae]|nr:hypothetical protein IM40_06975 [Candidatus Paracaedimonas acanthamoebae]